MLLASGRLPILLPQLLQGTILSSALSIPNQKGGGGAARRHVCRRWLGSWKPKQKKGTYKNAAGTLEKNSGPVLSPAPPQPFQWQHADKATGGPCGIGVAGNFPDKISAPLRIIPPLELEMHVVMKQFADGGQVLQVLRPLHRDHHAPPLIRLCCWQNMQLLRHFAPGLVPDMTKLAPASSVEARLANWASLAGWEFKRLNGPKLGKTQLDALVRAHPRRALSKSPWPCCHRPPQRRLARPRPQTNDQAFDNSY